MKFTFDNAPVVQAVVKEKGSSSAIPIDIPESYSFLFTPGYRYRVCYGGRGAGRSWQYARAMLVKALERKRRFLCCREVQRSVRESIHKLLSDQIDLLGLGKYFTIQDRNIVCDKTGSEFIFEGLYRNVNKIKSLEGIDIVDCEEAEAFSEESWQVLLPTIRKEGSEVWIKFNTRYVDDPTYQRFVANKPKDCVTVFTSWKDNPYFPEVLKREMQQDRAFRPHVATNVWDGLPLGTGSRVWPDFDRQVHVKEFPFTKVQNEAQVFMGLDPAYHFYPACVWVARFPVNNVLIHWVYSEWPSFKDLGDHFHLLRKKELYTGSLADMSREIYSHDGEGVVPVRRSIDSRFAKGSGSGSYVNDSQGMVSEMSKKENGGLRLYQPQEVLIDTMRSRVTTCLQYNHLLPVNETNQPSLFVAPWCSNMIQSLTNHRLEEGSEREDDKYKDFSDALRIAFAGMDKQVYKPPVNNTDWALQGQNKQKLGLIEQFSHMSAGSSETSWMGV